jgi:hypothetical protein
LPFSAMTRIGGYGTLRGMLAPTPNLFFKRPCQSCRLYRWGAGLTAFALLVGWVFGPRI